MKKLYSKHDSNNIFYNSKSTNGTLANLAPDPEYDTMIKKDKLTYTIIG